MTSLLAWSRNAWNVYAVKASMDEFIICTQPWAHVGVVGSCDDASLSCARAVKGREYVTLPLVLQSTGPDWCSVVVMIW